MKTIIHQSCLLLVCILLASPCTLGLADETENYIDWEKFSSMEPSRQGYFQYDERLMYWMDLTMELNKFFWDLYSEDIAEGNGGKRVRELVHGFGEHGFEVDIRLYLMAPDVFYPTDWDVDTLFPNTPKDNIAKGYYKELLRIVSETQVRDFLKEPKKLDRYFDSLVHSRALFHGRDLLVLNKKVKELQREFTGQSSSYACHARDFIILVHATGQDELLKGMQPMEVHKKFPQWLEWYEEHKTRLVGHPSKPIWIYAKDIPPDFPPELFPFEVLQLTDPRYPFPDWDFKLEPVILGLGQELDMNANSVDHAKLIAEKANNKTGLPVSPERD
ncbi:hypothetical protein [Aeoliella mucimassa]|uniref:DUF5106 domain-containing protein n=1 Tax=Aeoliella mucimassa TaxID=2527972 RepID=A0A518AKK1_9BACT|nr:hypothetical protein [Aeoliella mucimassa]QDU55250.1 hypothetical protein Pan181_14360 [Aeoliella mucimassa]